MRSRLTMLAALCAMTMTSCRCNRASPAVEIRPAPEADSNATPAKDASLYAEDAQSPSDAIIADDGPSCPRQSELGFCVTVRLLFAGLHTGFKDLRCSSVADNSPSEFTLTIYPEGYHICFVSLSSDDAAFSCMLTKKLSASHVVAELEPVFSEFIDCLDPVWQKALHKQYFSLADGRREGEIPKGGSHGGPIIYVDHPAPGVAAANCALTLAPNVSSTPSAPDPEVEWYGGRVSCSALFAPASSGDASGDINIPQDGASEVVPEAPTDRDPRDATVE